MSLIFHNPVQAFQHAHPEKSGEDQQRKIDKEIIGFVLIAVPRARENSGKFVPHRIGEEKTAHH